MKNASETVRLICLFLVLASAYSIAQLVECDNLNKYVYITNPKSGLVLNADTDAYISLQVLNESETQQWQLHPSSKTGLFNIINKYSGKALDIGAEVPIQANFLSANEREDNIYQQWFINSDQILINNGNKHIVFPYGGELTEGTLVLSHVRDFNDESADYFKFSLNDVA